MILLISPSKTQDYTDNLSCNARTKPLLAKHCLELVKVLKGFSKPKLAKTLGVSDKLATLNHQRYQQFAQSFTPRNARQALLAFRGDVYRGIRVGEYKKADFDYAQKHLRILSGLYGMLRPLDLIQPYRLEMKTKLKTPHAKDLYQYWEEPLLDLLEETLRKSKSTTIVNLASNEYYNAVPAKRLDAKVITPVFKEKKGSSYKTVAIFAKRARGLMADFAITKRIKAAKDLKRFSAEGYSYNPKLSDDATWTFMR